MVEFESKFPEFTEANGNTNSRRFENWKLAANLNEPASIWQPRVERTTFQQPILTLLESLIGRHFVESAAFTKCAIK
jgi:hypothetical protein